MDIHNARTLLRTKSFYDLPLRVVYYARVSSDKDEQLNSLSNQQSHYDDFIAKNPNWTFVGRYVDEGISGISTKKQEDFHRMVSDAKAGKYDLIIAKEITRFARNTLDSIHYTRELLSSGVAVWFQNDNINTLDEDAELRLTIMSGIAQDEVRKLSSRIKFGHTQAIKKGVVLGNSLMYGYEKQNGRLIINEAEAEMIRLIYSLYATGEYSTPKIERILYEKGYRSRKGTAINRGVIKHIIPNPKYKGYYCGNKVKIVDMFTKRQKFLPEDEWVMYKDESIVPAIVDEDLWQRANDIYQIRSNEVKSRRTSFKPGNLFTGKIICAEHGTPFYMKAHRIRQNEPDPTWVCSHKIKNGAQSCQSFSIKDSELTAILMDILHGISSDMPVVVERYMEHLKQASQNTDVSKQIAALEADIRQIEKKKERLLDLSLEGALSNAEFKKRNNAYNGDILAKENELQIYKGKEDAGKNAEKKLHQLKRELLRITEQPLEGLTSGIVNLFVDKIVYSATDDTNCAHLDIYLKTGATLGKPLCRAGFATCSRSGHMSNLMHALRDHLQCNAVGFVVCFLDQQGF